MRVRSLILPAAVLLAVACVRLGYADPPASPASETVDHDLEAMIGQMIMVGFIGTSPQDPWPAKLLGQIAAGQVGGVLFLGRNAGSRASVVELNQAILDAGGATPVLIAIDQEGGRIERLTEEVGFTERPSAQDVAASESVLEATGLYAGLARDLRDWNFNVNLGPVVDVNVNPDNPIIGALGRSFSGDPGTVTAYAGAFVSGHRASGVLTALKHFPGHGSSREDSHKGFVDVTETWTPSELEPYRALVAAGLVDMVMSGHLYLEQLSEPSATLPSSLSRPALDVLRDDIGFDGVIISDDMEMQAIEKHYTLEDAAVRAVRAGTNILVYSNYSHPRPDLPGEVIAILRRHAESDPQFRAMIEDSYRKILLLKGGLPRGRR